MLGNGLRAEIWKECVERFNIKNISELYGATEGNVSMGRCFLLSFVIMERWTGNNFTANYENKIGACGFIPILLKKLFPMTIVRLDDNNEPIRDPNTGLLIECRPNEIGELIGGNCF